MDDGIKILLGGQELWLSSRRCIWWPFTKTLVVADLHLGKGIDFSIAGILLPPYDVMDTLKRLEDLIKITNADRVICLGDNFHRTYSFHALKEWEQKRIIDLVSLVTEWVWITGNHDPDLPSMLPGIKLESMNDHLFGFNHQRNTSDNSKVQFIGHFHPKYTTMIQRHRISKPCFAWNHATLIMPSFGSYTGGLSINHPEIQSVLGKLFSIATSDTQPTPVIINKKLPMI
jgi:DNA ligase-associated metallophosphoesterase